jgi:hypothetical protein
LHALRVLALNQHKKETIADYQKIPMNKKNKLFHFLIRNTVFSFSDQEIKADIGIRKKSLNNLYPDDYIVEDIGDLSANGAYEETDLKNEKLSGAPEIGKSAEELIRKYFMKT